ncbi:ABC transporter substrate binding protein [Thiohalobacter sp. IOR34]|uniref:ABC transporter substrate-binding protein n=1 Tax=Thiohalobacter sp. IOR34 TaxID=3057176 RepID=UPI0025AF84C2|nr:ABC transporter substrate binding protein [Thiohalobacter sp. IOR34]WJW76146.1 ABC transporter substrate binding protein [Thiohalobacter sp. IOR34]
MSPWSTRSARRLRPPALAVLCLLLCGLAHAGQALAQDIWVLLSHDNGPYTEVADALREHLAPQARLRIARLDNARGRPDQPPGNPQLVISVGTRATHWALQHTPPVPLLSVLIPRQAYRRLTADHVGPARQNSAIFLDQPVRRRLNLLQLILPASQRIGILTAGDEADPELLQLLEQRRLQAVVIDIDDPRRLIDRLGNVLDDIDVLFAMPEPRIFNRRTIKPILLTTFRFRVPVIGFSRAYVRAGALAASYSTGLQIGRQAAEWVRELSEGKRASLPPPAYPRYFSVSVNRQVARSLGISLPHEQRLLERLRKLEEGTP